MSTCNISRYCLTSWGPGEQKGNAKESVSLVSPHSEPFLPWASELDAVWPLHSKIQASWTSTTEWELHCWQPRVREFWIWISAEYQYPRLSSLHMAIIGTSQPSSWPEKILPNKFLLLSLILSMYILFFCFSGEPWLIPIMLQNHTLLTE